MIRRHNAVSMAVFSRRWGRRPWSLALAVLLGFSALAAPLSLAQSPVSLTVSAAISVKDALDLLFAEDVRQVLTYVETGNADAGMMYKTDAQISEKVRVVATAPPAAHDAIVYPAAVIKASKNGAAATAFLGFLGCAEARGIFEKFGFSSPEKAAEKN